MFLGIHPVVPFHSTTGYPLDAPAGARFNRTMQKPANTEVGWHMSNRL